MPANVEQRERVRPAEPAARIATIQAAIAAVRADGGADGLRAALQHLTAIRETSTLCAGMHEVLGEVLPARNFSVALQDASGEGVGFAYHADELETAPPEGSGPRSLAGYVIRTNRSLLATPAVLDRLRASGEVDPVDAPFGSWLGTPLSDGDSTFGALVVKTYPDGPALGPREQALLEVASGQVGRALGRRHALEALHDSEARFRTLAENAPCAIFILQAGEIRFANEAARALTGYSPEDLAHRELWEVVHPEDREMARQRSAGMSDSTTPTRYEVKVLHRGGESRWVDFSGSVLNYRGQPALMGVGLDITERKLSDARIEALAYRDALTGLPNRRLLRDRMAVALAQTGRTGKRLAVLFLDLDDFKDVNDSLGHQAGDELLQAVAERLRKAMRGDDTVARIGGDEFVVLLTQIDDATQAALVGQKVLALLKAPVRVGERELFVNGSMGIAVHPEDGRDSDTLLKNADAAMYRAKEQGRDNCQLYTLSLHTAAMARLEMEGGLRRALERDELFLEYQPALDLKRRCVHGVEALMRWRHPVHGVLPPGDFLPMAEGSSLIVPMGWWALATACRQARAWQDLGHPDLTVAVNIAARQFHDPSFQRRVTDVLADTGLRASCLELEITETQAMQNPAATARVLTELSQLGVRISIDDFGTGYSSLSYLRRLPIHALKVDRSFVQDIDLGPDQAAIALATIRLAHTLKLSVQAEGVETPEQLDVLRQQDCDRIQGFLYSKPLGVLECEEFLLQHRSRPEKGGPRSRPDLAAQPAVANRPPCSIVLIDDSDEGREAIEFVLTRAGHLVAATGDPRAAVELVRQQQPGLVLCDIVMPGMDGYDVVRALQADVATARFPVVFLSARPESTERARALRFGVVDYIPKPIGPDELERRIARVMSTLDRRSGVMAASDGPMAAELVVEVERTGRTGLLTLRGEGAPARRLVRAGSVVDQMGGPVAVPLRAHFEELDPRQEHIVTNDPDGLLAGGRAPVFDDVPIGLREVLLADNNALFRGVLSSVLEARGFVVHDARDGEEALRMALRRPPQIALLDVRMAGLDGFEIRRRLRAHRATRSVPVVFLSGCQAYDEAQLPIETGEELPVSSGSSLHEILSRMQLLMQRYVQAGAAGPGGPGMQGSIEVIGTAGLLQMCHLARLTGALRATHQACTVRMTFQAGQLRSAASAEARGRQAVMQFLAWPEGRFEFQPGATAEGEPISEPTDHLILDACRILDEQSATRIEP